MWQSARLIQQANFNSPTDQTC